SAPESTHGRPMPASVKTKLEFHCQPEHERDLRARGFSRVAGIDEVGRGSLFGAVVAAAVVLDPAKPIRGLDDSKVLTAIQRAKFAVKIRERAFALAVGAASVREIDRLNIRRASILAMERALHRLGFTPSYILIDGLPCPELGCEHEAIVDGDARCHSIAAASVIAKVLRDYLMDRLAVRHPGYCWETNKGYATPEHLDAIHRLGPTRHHRYSFEPVAQIELLSVSGAP
ncbi:MAG TPA: ribonuclease HII, partial [Gemmatimonadales bacterium]|nr:ribonuclease HII [Gemmatimonadales bacterium]